MENSLMNIRKRALALVAALAAALGVMSTGLAAGSPTAGPFQFAPLPTSAACTTGGNPAQPLLLPSGYAQAVIASEPDYPDLPDMQTLNETGPGAGSKLYRTHETTSNGAVSV